MEIVDRRRTDINFELTKPRKKLEQQTVVFTDTEGGPPSKDGFLYAKWSLKGAPLKIVESWEDLAKNLQEFASINLLVLYFHGARGALTIGSKYVDLDDAAKRFFKDKDKLPKINQLDFQACNVAEGIAKTVPFAKMFKASQVTAWNYYHVMMPVSVPPIPKGVDPKEVDVKLAAFKDWLLENTPPASVLVKEGGEHILGAEWFRVDDDPGNLPQARLGEPDGRPKIFKRRRDKREVVLKTNEEVNSLPKKYADRVSRPFDHVTIDLTGLK